MQSLACAVTSFLIQKGAVTEEDREIYDYGFDYVLSKILQFGLLLVYGACTGSILNVFAAAMGMAVPREFIGGWHANSRLTCFCTFTATSLLAVTLFVRLPFWLVAAGVVAAVAVVFRKAPVTHYNNPKTEAEIQVLKVRSRWVFAVLSAAVLLLGATPLADMAKCGGAGLMISALLLLFPNREPEAAEQG